MDCNQTQKTVFTNQNATSTNKEELQSFLGIMNYEGKFSQVTMEV